jgi:sarcosine oxidase, subunit gamma
VPELIAALVAESCLPAGGHVFSDALRLSVLPTRVILRVQIGARSLKTVGAIRIAERPLPLAPNSWNGEDPVFCRIGPNDWWVISALHDALDLLQAVRKGCGKRSFAATDVSDAHVTLALDGTLVPALLARGCGLDLSDAAFAPGACTRTRLAQLPVVLRRVSSERIECIVDRPTTQYLYDWFLDAAAGLGVA